MRSALTCWRNSPANPRPRKSRPLGCGSWPTPSAQRSKVGSIRMASSVWTRCASGWKPKRLRPDIVAYVKFRYLSADYGRSMQEPNADFAKIQEKWLADLEKFVTDFANTKDAAEAMLQLAICRRVRRPGRKRGQMVCEDCRRIPRHGRRVEGRRRETPHGIGRSATGARRQGHPREHRQYLVVSRQSPADSLLGHVVRPPFRISLC